MGQQHVVVIGASMAGLVSARVLAERVARVTIVDRDTLPDGAVARRGVPQGRYAHGLLPAGERVIERLFPGLVDELVAGGAQRVAASGGRWFQGGGLRVDAPDTPDVTFFSRPFRERGVRARVEALPNVTVVQAAARSLVVDSGRVAGVTIQGAARSRSARPSPTACRPAVGATSRRSSAIPSASWPSATRSAASTRSTGRA
jgi:2-polyprenyl-6-methoxyphenol hydroxylase-like FAD-dependent oxidoreductase